MFLCFFKVFLKISMHELDRTQNYVPKIHEEYFIHDTPFLLPHPCADYKNK